MEFIPTSEKNRFIYILLSIVFFCISTYILLPTFKSLFYPLDLIQLLLHVVIYSIFIFMMTVFLSPLWVGKLQKIIIKDKIFLLYYKKLGSQKWNETGRISLININKLDITRYSKAINIHAHAPSYGHRVIYYLLFTGSNSVSITIPLEEMFGWKKKTINSIVDYIQQEYPYINIENHSKY
jgi:hypothetical protein